MATAAQQPPVGQGVQSVPLGRIQVSQTNPRKHFDKAALEELTASVAKHGILQPLLVRPAGVDRYELVAGERRYRAALAAKLQGVPVLVRELTDAEALEVQVIENLLRSDLHPLEEAEGYEQLQDEHKYDIDTIAAKVGKSKAYIYGRLKLCALCPEARKAFYEDKVIASTALLIARIPGAELQVQALRAILKPESWSPRVMTYREAADYVQRNFMLRLSEASFPTDDAELVPAAGPCSTCPKRTGNQRELFGDVKSADVCTDPPCFEKKTEAAWNRNKKAAEAKGTKVLEDGAAKKLFPYGNDRLGDRTPYVDLACENYEDPKGRKWGQLLGKAGEEHVVLARDPKGTVHRLVPKDQVAKLLKATGHAPAPRVAANTRDQALRVARAKAERAKTLLEGKVRARVMGAIVAKVTALQDEDLRLLAETLFAEMHHDSRKSLLAGLGIEIARGKYGYELMAPFRKVITTHSGAALAKVLLTMCISPRDYWPERRDPIAAVATRYKVDAARIRKDVVSEAKQASASKKKPRAK